MTLDRFAPFGWLLRATKPVPLLCLSIGGVAAADGVNTGYFGNVAIGGYDPVSYFTDGRATKGSPEISQTGLVPLGISRMPSTVTLSPPSQFATRPSMAASAHWARR